MRANKFCTAFALLLAAAPSACTRASAAGAPPGPYSVGVTTRLFDASPATQPLITEIWYPTQHALAAVDALYCDSYMGHALRDAPVVQSAAPFALVVLSHGKYGTRYDLSWLAEALASQGYIVAAVNHPGSDIGSYVDSEAWKLWVRAKTLSQVIDHVLGDPELGQLVDARRIGAAGYSLGGSTVLVLGGARVDADKFALAFPDSGRVDTASYRDDRVRVVVALAPGTGRAFTPEGVEAVRVPTLIVSGHDDQVAPEEHNARFFADNIAGAVWDSLPQGTHTSFQPQCANLESVLHLRLCAEDGMPRDAAHAQVETWVRLFLASSLR